MEDRIAKMPKWCRDHVQELQREIAQLKTERKKLQEAHAVLYGRKWFTIHGSTTDSEIYRLWSLSEEGAHPVCSLNKGDILLVGRKE
jgi:DNA-binding ferritin-like protein